MGLMLLPWRSSPSLKEIDGMMRQQMMANKNQWFSNFYEGPLWHVPVSKHDDAQEGAVYVPHGLPPSAPPSDSESSEWSHDRSIAGDAADIDWLHCYLEEHLSGDFPQYLTNIARRSIMNATRSERTGANVKIEFLELIWHKSLGNNGPFASLDEVRAFQKSRVQRCRLNVHKLGAVLGRRNGVPAISYWRRDGRR